MRRWLVPTVLMVCLVAVNSALAYSDSPKETMVAWYQALKENHELPSGRLMDAMIGFYSEDLQDQFMPEIDKRQATPDERSGAEKSIAKAVSLHKAWGAFLAANDFKEANFKDAEAHIEQGVATVVVRSDSNHVRSFRLIQGRGERWVISELPLPDQYAALVRVLVIVAVGAVALGLIAKKMIFS